MKKTLKVSGDSFYMQDGKAVLPLGTLTVEETKAPNGYLLDGAYMQAGDKSEQIKGLYVTQITEDGDLAVLSGSNQFSVSDKSVKCICINYGDFLADCEGFVQKRYHDFKCNPKHQFEKKADTILENAIHEKNFMPDLFLIRLNRKQSACNSQIDFVFELLDKSFLETDPIRKSEISEETLNLCLSADVSFIMVYIGMNR